LYYSRLKVGCIYYVNFNPHLRCEFDGNHLALVLKKNNDSSTVVRLLFFCNLEEFDL